MADGRQLEKKTKSVVLMDIIERIALYSTDCVDCTRQDSRNIKQALFVFLASVDRQI